MPKVKRTRLALEAGRRNAEQLVRLGREVYEGRGRRQPPVRLVVDGSRLFAWRRQG